MNEHTHEMKLRDDQWHELESFLMGKPDDPGASGKNNRLFIDAVLWVVSNHYIWKHLPAHFGRFNTTYMRFRRWTQSGFWRQLACSDIGDKELRLMLDQIVIYSDRYVQRIEQRQVRKAQRMRYDAKISAARESPSVKNFQTQSDESTLNWTGLVLPQ